MFYVPKEFRYLDLPVIHVDKLPFDSAWRFSIRPLYIEDNTPFNWLKWLFHANRQWSRKIQAYFIVLISYDQAFSQ